MWLCSYVCYDIMLFNIATNDELQSALQIDVPGLTVVETASCFGLFGHRPNGLSGAALLLRQTQN